LPIKIVAQVIPTCIMSCFLLTKRAMQSYRKYDMQIFVGQQEYLA